MHETNNGLTIQPMRDALQLIDMLPPSRESLSTDDVTHARSTSTGVGRFTLVLIDRAKLEILAHFRPNK